MSANTLAQKILAALQEQALDYDDEGAVEIVAQALTGDAPPGLPDRSPDFVFWIDHNPEGVTSGCIPGPGVTLKDWEYAASWFAHMAAKEAVLQSKGAVGYHESLTMCVQGAMEIMAEEIGR